MPNGNVMLGGDPEMFITRDVDGEAIPAHFFFPPKEKPIRMKEGKIFRDGFGVEFNPSPTTSVVGLIHNMGVLVREAERLLPPGHHLVPTSTVEVNVDELLKTAPLDVLESGCHPSRNAYGLSPNLPNLRYYPLRHSGGHIHMSGAEVLSHPSSYPRVIRRMDLYLGSKIREIFSSAAYDRRAQVYGLWGEYREQVYPGRKRGLEYRTLGPEIWSHPIITLFTYEVAKWVVLNDPPLLPGVGEGEMHHLLPGGKMAKPLPLKVPGIYSNSLTIFTLRKKMEKAPPFNSNLLLEWEWDWKKWSKEAALPGAA